LKNKKCTKEFDRGNFLLHNSSKRIFPLFTSTKNGKYFESRKKISTFNSSSAIKQLEEFSPSHFAKRTRKYQKHVESRDGIKNILLRPFEGIHAYAMLAGEKGKRENAISIDPFNPLQSMYKEKLRKLFSKINYLLNSVKCFLYLFILFVFFFKGICLSDTLVDFPPLFYMCMILFATP
jgi:hypothetical protein